MSSEVTKLQEYRKEIKSESESRISRCYCCGKEITFGRIFCKICDTPLNKQIFEFFSEFPKNRAGDLIRPRGEKLYQVIKYYLAARMGISNDKKIVLKSISGAGKSLLIDMIAFIEITHFPNSLTIIGSVAEKVSQEHIIRLREWISNSIFRRYMEGTHEATASKTEIKLAKLNSRVLSMPQSERTRTGWHPSLLLVDEVARMRKEAFYGSFFQMGRTTGVIQIACSTPFLDSLVMQDMWNDDDMIKIALEPDDCWWIPEEVFRDAKNMPSELYEQLFQAKFRSVSNRVIPDDLLLQAMQRGEHYPASKNLIMGIDFGRSIDPSAVVVLDIETGDVKFVETFNDEWQIQFQKIRKLYKDWNPIRIIADKSSIGDVIISDLQDLPIQGVSIHNDILKKQLVDKLVMAFYNYKINIVNEEFPKLVTELSNFVYYDSEHQKVGPIGRGHDDTVDSLALCLKAMDVSSLRDGALPDNLWSFTRIGGASSSNPWAISNV